MSTQIAPGVLYLTREDWGARPWVVGGHLMNPNEKTEVPIHHTVTVDLDATPDLWETVEEVKVHMRRLQVIRSDITDVPYNAVIFLMADGTIIICEGRGFNRSGAHTIGHNRKGYGVAFAANMEAPPNPNLPRFQPKINIFFGWVKAHHCRNLGLFFPHQQVSATACPGKAVIPHMDEFRYTVAPEMEDDVALILVRKDGENAVWLTDWIWKYHVTAEQRDAARAIQVPFLDPMPEFLEVLLDGAKATIHPVMSS